MKKHKRGRKPVGESPTVNKTIRMLPEQAKKLNVLGGPKWVRDRIDRAKVKDEKDIPPSA